MGQLLVVATPIGNLEDITLRALRACREADVIAAEDTRVTRKLLSHFDIHTPLISFHGNSGPAAMKKILALLEDGSRVALVTDAGTPSVSDPGSELVSAVREQLPDTDIVAVPGPSALTAALSVAGLKTHEFVFYGFLPHKKGRATLFTEIAENTRASIFYESTHRIMKTLESLAAVLPDGRRVGLCKELTKAHERVFIGSARELYAILAAEPALQKGEFVVLVEGK